MDKNKTVEVLDYTNCQMRYKCKELLIFKNNLSNTPVSMDDNEIELINNLHKAVVDLLLFYNCEIVSNEVIINDIFIEMAEEGGSGKTY